MVNFPGRNARRRRVLNDEVLSASGTRSNAWSRADDESTDPPPRYSDAAGVEHHPQVTDFVPRRYRTILMVVLAGLISSAALAMLHHIVPTIAGVIGADGAAAFDLSARGSLAAWLAAIVLFIAAVVCLLIYSIRRHRIDDIRGRYRVWLSAAAACLILSADSIAGLHDGLIGAFGAITGWTLRGGGAMWPLALAGLPFAWISLRSFLDVRECRLAAMVLVAAVGCYAAAITSCCGIVAVDDPEIETICATTPALIGHWLLLTAVVSYARFVILDAQGLIPSRRSSSQSSTTSGKAAAVNEEDDSDRGVISSSDFQRQRTAVNKRAAKAWVDGSRPERESFQDDDGDDETSRQVHKLSKSDRKRLRKLKEERRAA